MLEPIQVCSSLGAKQDCIASSDRPSEVILYRTNLRIVQSYALDKLLGRWFLSIHDLNPVFTH